MREYVKGSVLTFDTQLTHSDNFSAHDFSTSGSNRSICIVRALDVPEPSTFALLGLGTFGLLAYEWRRRKAKA